ncbi:MAG TPA: globin domain-containing protein [Streptosporangiaceae bacterium]
MATARTESSARLAEPDRAGPAATAISLADRQLVKDSYGRLMASQQFAMEYLYARLFVQHPRFRALFPFSMEHTRTSTFEMLGKLVASLDNPDQTDLLLDRLGRDHRKFGVKEHHYGPFFDALLATVEQISGRSWAGGLDVAWTGVLGYFADAMKTAAAQDARDQPAWWIGEIVQHDRRSPTIAVLTIRPDRPLRYEPGQYITVQVPKWPRLWRRYSIANAPRENGLLDIHVRAVPGGMVSTALVGHSGTGDILTLAAAGGDLRVPADPERDLVCVAGGTGLAPIKAIVESVVGELRQGKRREITLYVGARRSSDLYDMRDLATLRLAYPALTLIPVVETELEGSAQIGRLPDVVKSHPSFRNTEVYLAGPASMISATRRTLSARVPSDRFHHDPLDVLVAASRPVAILRSASDHLRGAS